MEDRVSPKVRAQASLDPFGTCLRVGIFRLKISSKGERETWLSVGGEAGGMRVGTVELVETVGESIGESGEGEGESGGLAVAGSGGTDVMAGVRGGSC